MEPNFLTFLFLEHFFRSEEWERWFNEQDKDQYNDEVLKKFLTVTTKFLEHKYIYGVYNEKEYDIINTDLINIIKLPTILERH